MDSLPPRPPTHPYLGSENIDRAGPLALGGGAAPAGHQTPAGCDDRLRPDLTAVPVLRGGGPRALGSNDAAARTWQVRPLHGRDHLPVSDQAAGGGGKKKGFTTLSDPEVKAKHDAAALGVWKADDPDGAAAAEAARLRAATGVTSLVPTQVRTSTRSAAPPLFGKSPEELGLVKVGGM